MRNECLNAALAELAKAGVHYPKVTNGGSHLKVRWFATSGQVRTYVLPATPSDWRAPRNVRAGVRHILRADGMLERRPAEVE